MSKIRTAILGASGYTGAETLRLLYAHPNVEVVAITAERHAGKSISQVFPFLRSYDLPRLCKIHEVDFDDISLVFTCLPHGTSQEVIRDLPEHVKIIDLSADFRLSDTQLYEDVYGNPHAAPEIQETAIYGLSEWAKDRLVQTNARLVACPGCFPTSVLLPLIPLVKGQLIDTSEIIIDSKTGASGAGRTLKENLLHSEASEGMGAYAIGQHRHAPEMEHILKTYADNAPVVSFTPHLAPMNRGIISTLYLKMVPGVKVGHARNALVNAYKDDPFVQLLDQDVSPNTQEVRGTNFCRMGLFEDRIPGRLILVSVIDNLTKGSSGQAVQNMNLMFGWPEIMGLEQLALFP